MNTKAILSYFLARQFLEKNNISDLLPANGALLSSNSKLGGMGTLISLKALSDYTNKEITVRDEKIDFVKKLIESETDLATLKEKLEKQYSEFKKKEQSN